MAGRLLDQIFAWFGYGLVVLRDHAKEREVAAGKLADLEERLASAVRDRDTWLRKARKFRARTEDNLRDQAKEREVAAEKLVGLEERLAVAVRDRDTWVGKAGKFRAQAERNAAEGEAYRKERDRARDKAAVSARRLADEKVLRKEALEEIAALQTQLGASIDPESHARARARLEIERSNVLRLKVKLDQTNRRFVRQDGEIEVARRELRVLKAETDKIRGEEQRLLSEMALEAAGPGLEANSDAHLDAAVTLLSKARSGRRGARPQAAQAFQLGEAFQEQGAAALAAACYRRMGSYGEELLAQEGPDGDRISGPDFLVIGAARAGTTWLKKCLAHHPQLFVLAGEHHYFSALSHQPVSSYVERFSSRHARFLRPGAIIKERTRPSERLYGEKSTTYLAMPQAHIDLCAALYPKLRLICLVRDPIVRLWSHLKHLKANDVLDNFNHVADLPASASVRELIRQGRYEDHLRRWARRFDPEQILLVDFERITREPEAVHAEVLAHIGAVPAPAPRESDTLNRTDGAKMPAALATYLHAAFAQERFDVPHLRAVMEQAAGEAQATRGPLPAPGATARRARG